MKTRRCATSGRMGRLLFVLCVLAGTALGGPTDRPSRPDRPSEWRAPGSRRSRNPVVAAIDADGDGELSPEEIRGAAAVLKKLDKNGDGKLSREEMRPAEGRGGEGRREGRDRGGRPPQRPAGDQREAARPASARPVAKSAVPGFVAIPGGTFEMGDHHGAGGGEHRSDELPVHTVRIDPFDISATEVSNRQYCEFLNAALSQKRIEVKQGRVLRAGTQDVYCDTDRSDPAGGILWKGGKFAVAEGKEDHPAVCIRWCGAAAYCNWLGEQKGYQALYDPVTWKCDFTKKGFRLPMEAEWEYAARGGRYGPYCLFPWGDEPDLARANWPRSGDPYEAGPLPWTTPVGFYDGKLHRKADFNWPGRRETYQTADGANGYGLYDVAGNVWEWCNDWYNREYYRTSPKDNPTGPAAASRAPDGRTYHVLRGGNWYNGEYGHSRVANRNLAYFRGPRDPDHSWYHVGFRPVLDLTEPVRGAASGGAAVGASAKTVGLIKNDPRAWKGYTLFAPKHYTATYLIDNAGRRVHSWTKSKYEPGQSVYLLPNGNLLRCCFIKHRLGTGGGEGGRVEEYDWGGNLVWEFDYRTDTYAQHHDIQPLPNGNILMLAVEKKTQAECIAAGFQPRDLRDGYLLPDYVVEIKKTGPKSGEVVWEWHVWDHLIQDEDRSKANYGDPSKHPERIDTQCNGRGARAFWNHMNSIAYNAKLDQVILSVRGCSELWVIDHSTTTKEGAGRTGGKYGKGGDLLYRWGNPAAYGSGSSRDQTLFQQHDAQWIPAGCPGAGNILIFNNGLNRVAGPGGARDGGRRGRGGGYSSVDEIVPPVDERGRYALAAGGAYAPAKPKWTYAAANRADFYAEAISGAQRLPNGNTLICDGTGGNFFEVTPGGETVWKYVCPVVRDGPLAQGEKAGSDHRGHAWNAVFKIHRYAADYAGLAGRDLTPGGPVELPASKAGQSRYSASAESRLGPARPGGGQGGRDDRGGRRGRGERRPGGPRRREGERRER